MSGNAWLLVYCTNTQRGGRRSSVGAASAIFGLRVRRVY
jgi:hypothetical protein